MTQSGGPGKSYDIYIMSVIDLTTELLKDSLPAPNNVCVSTTPCLHSMMNARLLNTNSFHSQ